jgi:hypothetical protein
MHSLSYHGGFITLANPAKDLKFTVSKVVYRSSKMFAFLAIFIASHQLVFVLPHGVRQDQRLYKPC